MSEPGADRPRVLHCLWNGEAGGLERAVYQLVRQQLRTGSVTPAVLFANDRGPWVDRFRRLGCPVISLEMPNGRSLLHLRTAKKAMRPFDIHHFHAAEPVLMLASMGCRSVRRIYTHRGGQTEYPLKQQLRYRVTGALLRNGFQGLSANTAYGAKCAPDVLHVAPGRFRVTYNGIEFGLLEPTRPAEEIRAELGISPTDFVLGTASILRPWKRIDRLVEILPAITDLDGRLVVVGDGPERSPLERLARDLDLEARVIFTGFRDHVADYLQIMDTFCLPATMESFGNAAVEAMALGVPTIVFADGGGLVEHIESGATGFIVSDGGELEDTLRRLAGDPALRRTIGDRGRAAIRQRYTLEKSAARYDDLYGSVLLPDAVQPAAIGGES